MYNKQKISVKPINKKDNKCFQYAVTVTLNHEKIGIYPERITTINPFINNHNWKKINFLSRKEESKKVEKNNVTIAPNVLYVEKEKIDPVWKHISNWEKWVIFLMIPNRGEWNCLAVKKLSTLLRGITSKHHGHFYCLNCLHSFTTENKLESN